MVRRTAWRGAALALAFLLVSSCSGTGPTRTAIDAAGGNFVRLAADTEASLASFDGCDAMVQHVQDIAIDQLDGSGRGYAMGSGPVPLVAPSSGAPAENRAMASASGAAADTASSEAAGAWGGTNIQEAGVDEPDTVKTDGQRVVIVDTNALRVVEVAGGEMTMRGELTLPAGDHQLLVGGNTALVISNDYARAADDVVTSGVGAPIAVATDGAELSPMPFAGRTKLVAVDLGGDGAAMQVRAELTLDGSFVDARLVDGMIRLVTVSTPTLPPPTPEPTPSTTTAPSTSLPATTSTTQTTRVPPGPASSTSTTTTALTTTTTLERKQSTDPAATYESQVRAATDPQDWLPKFEARDAGGDVVDRGPMVACDAVAVPADPAGLSMVNVVSLDLRADELVPDSGVSVVGGGELVYASAKSLYVTTPSMSEDGRVATDIHKFGIGERGPAVYRASGRVDGTPLNQFSLSELDGDLRMATTQWATTGGSSSSVVVLREVDGELRQVGRVDGLGKGEQIYAVRFVDDVGYVVTFRRTDPLYTIDLHDPSAPAVVGELKIPGYSSYLHPIGEGLVLGIGQDVGLQLAVFDVSDPAQPRQVQKLVVPGASSAAESDHHAFTWVTDRGVAVLPEWAYGGLDGGAAFQGAVAYAINAGGIVEQARITHPAGGGSGSSGGSAPGVCPPNADCPVWIGGGQVARSVVVGESLVTLSDAGVKATSLDTYTDTAWLPFA